VNRQHALENLRQHPKVDVLVIGGGVNGIGTFRDLALQGVRVALVERGDFCSGASAGSSHMLHGGIRYLENGEFRLVREALHERNLLLKNAPHYAKPLPTTIPMFRWFSGLLNAPLKFLGILEKPSERGAIVIKLGLMMYDFFTGKQQTMPYHSVKGKTQSLKRYPKLNPAIVASATYYDAYMPYPERLCIELLNDAINANPNAVAVNYCGVCDGDKHSVTVRDELTGETLTLEPSVVINAAGPWIDFVNEAMGKKTGFIGGTKGSHLIVDHPELYEATGGSEIFFENEDGRIVLIFPYMGKVMIGTTDIRIDNPDEVRCTEDEVQYMLNLVKRVFPTIEVKREQIVFVFTGVRPLPATKDKRTGAISRDHSINSLPKGTFDYGVHSLVGGKWTTFRAFSEQAANVALNELNLVRKVDTSGLSIGGGRDYPREPRQQQAWLEQLQRETELDLTHLAMLFERYGTHAKAVAKFMSAGNDAPLKTLPHYTQREITFLCQTEAIVHIDDFLLRRSLVAMLGQARDGVIEEVGQVMAGALGWTAEQTEREVSHAHAVLLDKHTPKTV
jgi:glycerol-3-phosphate dehydrogenase